MEAIIAAVLACSIVLEFPGISRTKAVLDPPLSTVSVDALPDPPPNLGALSASTVCRIGS